MRNVVFFKGLNTSREEAMETDHLAWMPGSFYRRPEWRWLRAEYLVATGCRRDARIDDDWVDLARAAIEGRSRSKKSGDVHAARGVWAGDVSARAELEALLLTDEPIDRIAERFHISTAVVEAYAEVFFAVRPMREATDWLLARAVGYSAIRGFTGPLPGAAWKLAALAGGPVLLDVVMAATTGRPLPHGFLTGSGPRRAFEGQRVRLLARLWVATLAATSDADFARVVTARRRLRALEAKVTGFPQPVTRAVVRVERFLKALPAMHRKGLALGGSGAEPDDDVSWDPRGALGGGPAADEGSGEGPGAASRLVREINADIAALRAAFAGCAAGAGQGAGALRAPAPGRKPGRLAGEPRPPRRAR